MRITLRGDCNHVTRHLSFIVTSACTGHDDILSPGLAGYIDSNVNSRTQLHSQVCLCERYAADKLRQGSSLRSRFM